MHNKIIFALCFCTLLTFGCARTVTLRETPLYLEIKLTTRGNIDTEKNNYLFIFRHDNTSNILLPPVNPGTNIYFPTPGRTFDTYDSNFSRIFTNNGIQYFYANYFSSWSDYIVVYKGNMYVYNSNSSGFNATTTSNFTYTNNKNRFTSSVIVIGNVLTLTLDISVINKALSGKEYMTIATTRISNFDTQYETGYFMDKTDPLVTLTIESQQKAGPFSNPSSSSLLPDSCAITKWEARLY